MKAMKKFSHVIMLLWGLSVTGSCLAQNSDYKWLQGEWKNDVYGDIADIYPNDSIRFLKNGLVFSEEEIDELIDALGDLPTTIDDLKGHILFCEKFPYEIGSWHESIANGDIEALLFECRADEYPYEPISTYLGIDNEQKQLFYYSDDGEKVVLTKTSELVYEEQMEILEKQMQIEVEEKNKNLRNEMAEYEFYWMQGQWNLDYMVGIIAYLDDCSIMVQRGSFSETGAFEVERTQSEPINLQYRINNFTKEVELVLEPFDICVDKESHSLYTYYDFDQRIEFEKVSEVVPPIVIAAREDPQVVSGKPKEENKQYNGNARRVNHKTIVPWVLCVLGALLLVFVVVWMIRKTKTSTKKSLWQNKWVKIAAIVVVVMVPILVFVVHRASTKGLGNVISTKEFIQNEEDGTERKAILATLNDGSELGFFVLREAPNQVTLIHCEHEKIPASGKINIPNQIKSKGSTYMVSGIGDGAFMGCSDLTSVSIPNSVTSIGESAFEGCLGLTSIAIPNSVTNIGNNAFYDCEELIKIVVAEGNSKFDSRNNCNAIIETASNTLVQACRNTIIPKDVTRIEDGAFANCEGLTSITIPANVTSIGICAFSGCKDLTKIVVDEDNRKYDSRGDCNAVIETASNTLVAACCNTTIPNGVTSIGEWAFSGCVGLTSITIPNTVKCIEKKAFNRCSGLTSIIIPNSVTDIGYGAFFNCNGLTSVTLPNSVMSIGADAFSGCEVLTSITIPQNVINIMPWTFANCWGLVSVTISDGVMHIGDYAFFGCSNLTSVAIPNSVTNIGDHAFEGCYSLTSIAIPDGVTSIGDEAFRSCTGLTSVTIPNSVTNIGLWAFGGCTGLTSAIIQNPNLQSQYDYVFIGCDKLHSKQSTVDLTALPNKTTTFKYQTDIMPYLRDHKFVASNGDYLTFTNSYIKNGQGEEIGVTQYELLGWDSETALMSAHNPYGTPPIIIYVYAAEGHIVIDNVMYFAK